MGLVDGESGADGKIKKVSYMCTAPHCEKLASEALRYGSHSYTANTIPAFTS